MGLSPCQYVDLYWRLTISGCCEDFSFLCWYCCIRFNQLCHYTPIVSMPSDKGVTSRRRTSFTSPVSTPPWIAAPTATTSSGLTPLDGTRPKNFSTSCWIAGIRVDPPTSSTSLISDTDKPESFNAIYKVQYKLVSIYHKFFQNWPGKSFYQMLWNAVYRHDIRKINFCCCRLESSILAFRLLLSVSAMPLDPFSDQHLLLLETHLPSSQLSGDQNHRLRDEYLHLLILPQKPHLQFQDWDIESSSPKVKNSYFQILRLLIKPISQWAAVGSL